MKQFLKDVWGVFVFIVLSPFVFVSMICIKIRYERQTGKEVTSKQYVHMVLGLYEDLFIKPKDWVEYLIEIED